MSLKKKIVWTTLLVLLFLYAIFSVATSIYGAIFRIKQIIELKTLEGFNINASIINLVLNFLSLIFNIFVIVLLIEKLIFIYKPYKEIIYYSINEYKQKKEEKKQQSKQNKLDKKRQKIEKLQEELKKQE